MLRHKGWPHSRVPGMILMLGWLMDLLLAAATQHHETESHRNTSSPRINQNSKLKVRFLLNAYSFGIILKTKSHKSNHFKSETIWIFNWKTICWDGWRTRVGRLRLSKEVPTWSSLPCCLISWRHSFAPQIYSVLSSSCSGEVGHGERHSVNTDQLTTWIHPKGQLLRQPTQSPATCPGLQGVLGVPEFTASCPGTSSPRALPAGSCKPSGRRSKAETPSSSSCPGLFQLQC